MMFAVSSSVFVVDVNDDDDDDNDVWECFVSLNGFVVSRPVEKDKDDTNLFLTCNCLVQPRTDCGHEEIEINLFLAIDGTE
jgi:hypothetical protein